MAIEDILKAIGAIPKVPLQEEQPNLETINYEYLVRFDDGLKPCLTVYGTSQEGRIYGMDAIVGLVLCTGVAPFYKEGLEGLYPVIEPEIHVLKQFFGMKEGDTSENFEDKMKKDCLEGKTNLIKVENLLHIDTVIGRHALQYTQQFEGLARDLGDRFHQFIKEHPEYFGRFKFQERKL